MMTPIEIQILLARQDESLKTIYDVEEDFDPALSYLPGSNLDGASIDQDDITEHAKHLGGKHI